MPRSSKPLSDWRTRGMMVLSPIAFRLSLGAWGVKALWAWCATLCAVLLLCGGFFLRLHLKMRRLRKTHCDDRVEYARRWRVAFGNADFTDYELAQIRRFQRKGDLAAIDRFIAASDAQLRAAGAAKEL